MAVATNLTDISLCESLTNWAVSGGPTMGLKSAAADDVAPVEGTYSIGGDVDIETGVYLYDYYTANGNTVLDCTDKHIYVWALCITANFLDTQTNGGLRIVLEDGSGNQGYWYVGGSDTYSGGWARFLIDGNSTPTANNGTNPTLSTIYKVGFSFKATAKSKLPENCMIDLVQYGSSIANALTITGGTSGTPLTWEDILTGDQALAKPTGVIRKVGGVFFLQGPLLFGDTGTGDMYFGDSNQVVVWEDTLASISYYDITLTGNSTGTTSFVLGSVTGTGDTRFGSGGGLITAAGSHRWTFDAETNTTNIDACKLYGCNLQKSGIFQLKDNTSTQEAISTTFDTCSMVQPNETVILNCNFLNSVDTSGACEFLNGDDDNVTNCLFRNCDNSLYFPSGQTAERTLDNIDIDTVSGNYDIYNASGSTVIVNVPLGSAADSYNPAGSAVTFITNPVTTKVIVKDISTGLAVQGARVLVTVADGTNFPYQETVTITSASTTATVAHTAHGLSTGDNVLISGANENGYTGAFEITVTGVDAYTYTMAETTTSPATGTITSTLALLNGDTDVNGEISDLRSIAVDQDIEGRVRKSSSSPYYQTSPISNTATSTGGITIVTQLIRDE